MILALLMLIACAPEPVAANIQKLGFSWDLDLRAEDAELDGSAVDRVEAVTGQVFDDAADPVNRPSLAGRSQGGVTPLTFDADGRLQTESGIVAGDTNSFTVEVVHQPADVYGVLDRGYLLYVVNNTPSAPYHHVIAHTANSPSFKQKGIYVAGAWKLALPSVEVYTGLQVETWVVRSTGEINLWRNGHEVDHYEWTPSTIQLDQLVLGAGWGSPLATAYRGQIYQVRASGHALTRAQIHASQLEQISRFNIVSDYSWRPTDEASATGWWSEHGMRRTAGDTYQWDNRLNAYHASQGDSTRKPSFSRINGLLAVSCDGVDERLTGYSLSYYFGASTYEYAAIVELGSVGSGGPQAYNYRQIFGDTHGFMGGSVRPDGSGGYEFVAWHYNGSVVKTAVAGGLTLGARHTVHGWLESGTLHAAVDGVEGTPATSAGSVSNRVYQLTMCGRNDSTSLEVKIGQLITFSEALSTDSRAELEAFLERNDT